MWTHQTDSVTGLGLSITTAEPGCLPALSFQLPETQQGDEGPRWCPQGTRGKGGAGGPAGNVLLLFIRFLLQSIHSQNCLRYQATVLPYGGGRGGRKQGPETDSTQSYNVRPSLKF